MMKEPAFGLPTFFAPDHNPAAIPNALSVPNDEVPLSIVLNNVVIEFVANLITI